MKITSLLKRETIKLKATCKNKEDAIKQAVELMAKSGVITDTKIFTEGVFKREKESTTGVGDGIAIPHFKSKTVKKPMLVAMVIPKGVEFASLDGQPVDLLFMIAAPDNKDNVHLDVLARLSSMLMHPEFKESLLKAKSVKEFLQIIDKSEEKRVIEEQAKKEFARKTQEHTNKHFDIVGVTACPTGIAHTYMAEEALIKAAKEAGLTIKIETQGANPKNFLTDEDIKNAKVVIVAADIAIQMERFNGKKLISVSTSRAIKDSPGLIKRSQESDVPTYTSLVSKTTTQMRKISTIGDRPSFGKQIYRHLMSGISHMLPFIVAGGILLAISYIIDGAMGVASTDPMFGKRNLASLIFNMLGNNLVIVLMVPALAGFISYSIAGKQGLVSGFFAGMAATTIILWAGWTQETGVQSISVGFNLMWFIDVGTNGITVINNVPHLPFFAQLAVDSAPGFFGGLCGGFASGYIVLGYRKLFERLPKTLHGIRDLLLMALVSTVSVAIFMLIMNTPFSFVSYGISLALTGLNNVGQLWLVCILVGALTSIDMGGPICKAAHLFTIGFMSQAQAQAATNPDQFLIAQYIMASNIAGSLIPPFSIAVTTLLFPQKYSKEDRAAGPTNFLLGICGITEGAIPFVAKKPIMWAGFISGAGIAGLMSGVFKGVAICPEGGTISYFIMAAQCWRALLGVVIGIAWASLVIALVRKDVDPREAQLGKWKGIPTRHIQHAVQYAFSRKYRKECAAKKVKKH